MERLVMRPFTTHLPSTDACRKAALAGAVAAVLAAGSLPAGAQSCLEQIVTVQQQLQAKLPQPQQPPTEAQSIGAQDAHDPTPADLASSGLSEVATGAWGALNAAMNMQAAGDEAGCLKALGKARQLGGLD